MPIPAGLTLFGYLFLLALLGTWPIDKRRARLLGDERWQRTCLGETSTVPFVRYFIVVVRSCLWRSRKLVGWCHFVAFAIWSISSVFPRRSVWFTGVLLIKGLFLIMGRFY